jgi:ABC-type multidrug transport system ATPase subunit
MSMNFPNNSIILIEGKNGSGKSVTLKMLANIMTEPFLPSIKIIELFGKFILIFLIIA